MADTKQCSRCKKVKPVTRFSRRKASKDGLTYWCKACSRAYNKEYHRAGKRSKNTYKAWYEENREEITKKSSEYYYQNRGRVLKRQKTYRKRNKDKIAARKKAYRKANQERRSKAFRDWRLSNSDKIKSYYHAYIARKANAPGEFTADEWTELCESYNNTCLACGKHADETPEGKLSADHVIPLSKGGSNDISNIQPLCVSCNSSKNDKIIDYRYANEK